MIAISLPETEFTAEELKELYNQRWGIETGFGEVMPKLLYSKWTEIGIIILVGGGRLCINMKSLVRKL